jgi:nucleoside-diphosphate-sugar epimerase
MAETGDRAALLHVVLGAAGGTGAAVVRELVGQGRSVRAVTRHGRTSVGDGAQPPASYQDAAADVTDRGQLRRALQGAAVVYHCAQPAYTRWAQEFPAMNRAVIDAAASTGAKLVFADNLYMYAPGASPITEDTPATATTKKGRVRAAMAEELLAAHHDGKVRVAIGRSSDYFGPGGLDSAVGARFFRSVVTGKKTQWFADLDQPHTLSYLPDMARALVVLGTRPEADGRVWHLPAADARTGRQVIEAAARAAGASPAPVVLGMGTVRLAGLFVPVLREFPELWYEWDRPFVLDSSCFEEAFGPFAVTPLDRALGETVTWFKRRGV